MAADLVSDWVRGRLPAEQAAEVEAHVRSCDECRAVAEIARSVQHEVASHGAGLFSPHPSPDELSRFVLEPDRLALPALATIGEHVRACPTCASDSTLVRRAGNVALGRRLAAWFAVHRTPSSLLRPAFAVLAIALVYPAYLGLVEYPRLRDQARGVGAGAHPPAAESTPLAWSGSGVDPLVLAPAVRGAEPTLPTLRLRPGQPAQPIFINREPPAGATRLNLMLRDHAGAIVWQIEAPVAELWNRDAQVIALLVPADRLRTGDYQMELMTNEHAAPVFTAGFHVLAAPQR
jgi:hypothetical protein